MKNRALTVVTAVIKKNRKYLLVKQAAGVHKRLWAFPGGKVEPDETPEAAVKREILEELGLRITPMNLFRTLIEKNDNPSQSADTPLVAVLFFNCRVSNDRIKPADDVDEYAWVSTAEMKRYSLRPAMEGIIPELEEFKTAR